MSATAVAVTTIGTPGGVAVAGAVQTPVIELILPPVADQVFPVEPEPAKRTIAVKVIVWLTIAM